MPKLILILLLFLAPPEQASAQRGPCEAIEIPGLPDASFLGCIGVKGVLLNTGDDEHWLTEIKIENPGTDRQLLEQLVHGFSERNQWTLIEGEKQGSAINMAWRVVIDGEVWTAETTLTPFLTDERSYWLRFHIKKTPERKRIITMGAS